MSTPSIPNLNTLRTGKFNRGRSRIRPSHNTYDHDKKPLHDQVIQQTDDDASSLRMSAVETCYLSDPFAKYFIDHPNRKLPIINRGTYVRTSGIDRLIQQFLSTESSFLKQIVSLGAGSDTRYFRLVDDALASDLIYHEIDFAANTAKKIANIKQHSPLLDRIQSSLPNGDEVIFDENDTAIFSSRYNLHPFDLRDLTSCSRRPSENIPKIRNLNKTAATLLISECCLCYIYPNVTDEILKVFSSLLIPPETPLALVIYEPIRPDDPFGRMMISNLASRGIVLQTLKRFSTLARQRQRFRDCGFRTAQVAADINFVWEAWIAEDEKERVASLEMLDELEEWHLVAKHYCIAWGWREIEGSGHEPLFSKAWVNVPSQNDDDEDNDIDVHNLA